MGIPEHIVNHGHEIINRGVSFYGVSVGDMGADEARALVAYLLEKADLDARRYRDDVNRFQYALGLRGTRN